MQIRVTLNECMWDIYCWLANEPQPSAAVVRCSFKCGLRMSNIRGNTVLRLWSEDTWLQLLIVTQFCVIVDKWFSHVLFLIVFSNLQRLRCSATYVACSISTLLKAIHTYVNNPGIAQLSGKPWIAFSGHSFPKWNFAFSWLSCFKNQSFKYSHNTLQFAWLK